MKTWEIVVVILVILIVLTCLIYVGWRWYKSKSLNEGYINVGTEQHKKRSAEQLLNLFQESANIKNITETKKVSPPVAYTSGRRSSKFSDDDLVNATRLLGEEYNPYQLD